MKYATRIGYVVGLAALAVILAVLVRRGPEGWALALERMASPGRLSAAHSFLESNCAACHTTAKGPDAAKCIACHAGEESLLGRQPTAFHATVSSCRECHGEHQGRDRPPAAMDHDALARIGLGELGRGVRDDVGTNPAKADLLVWLKENRGREFGTPNGPGITAREAALDCATCHSTKDRHQTLLGKDCAECHSTAMWTIPQFRHPSPQSTDCAQCHQAPPSHYMEHFRMISETVAGHHGSEVRQCYLCHQTTSWNDIKGVGWYKHH